MTNSIVATSVDQSLVSVERVFDAPRELLFKLVTDPLHLAQFSGPHGVTNTISEMDVQPGGVWRQIMRFLDGSEHAVTSIYLEVIEPERIVYRDAPHGSKGGLAGLPPAQLVTSILFENLNGRTKLTAQVRWTSAAALDQAMRFAEGMSQGNEKLAAYLTGL